MNNSLSQRQQKVNAVDTITYAFLCGWMCVCVWGGDKYVIQWLLMEKTQAEEQGLFLHSVWKKYNGEQILKSTTMRIKLPLRIVWSIAWPMLIMHSHWSGQKQFIGHLTCRMTPTLDSVVGYFFKWDLIYSPRYEVILGVGSFILANYFIRW